MPFHGCARGLRGVHLRAFSLSILYTLHDLLGERQLIVSVRLAAAMAAVAMVALVAMVMWFLPAVADSAIAAAAAFLWAASIDRVADR